ncbi:ABC transporter substrate-binding protein [Actinoplanes sp. NPDC051343]|uniref:ABC transporter substrate-binding protein n=1 Tax=Actinoplanes sp. NPDC051343 TaxID=3363906 RepID=UPI0037877CD0
MRLSLACGDYDRTRPLIDGTVRPNGLELTCLPMPVEEIFFRMARFREFDAAELSLGSYLVSRPLSGPFVAIPVFPSRSFRHSGIYVPVDSPASSPSDLAGKTVGLAEYQLTANIWIRGILAERHGLPVEAVRYRTGGLHAPGRPEKLAVSLPPTIDIAPIGAGETLSDLLAAGSIDALYTPRTPRAYVEGRARRLFPDFPAVEEQYFRDTGIFPIMHVVVLRADVYQRDRWIARSLLDAFVRARQITLDGMAETAALRYMLPWLVADVEHARSVLGDNYWTYGLPGNEAALSALVGYAHSQGLIDGVPAPADLFAPETLADTVI